MAGLIATGCSALDDELLPSSGGEAGFLPRLLRPLRVVVTAEVAAAALLLLVLSALDDEAAGGALVRLGFGLTATAEGAGGAGAGAAGTGTAGAEGLTGAGFSKAGGTGGRDTSCVGVAARIFGVGCESQRT